MTGEVFTPETLAALMRETIGPSFDTADLAEALGDGSAIRHAQTIAGVEIGMRQHLVDVLAAAGCRQQTALLGIVALLSVPTHLPALRALRDLGALLTQRAGPEAHLVAAAQRRPSRSGDYELDLWVRLALEGRDATC